MIQRCGAKDKECKVRTNGKEIDINAVILWNFFFFFTGPNCAQIHKVSLAQGQNKSYNLVNFINNFNLGCCKT